MAKLTTLAVIAAAAVTTLAACGTYNPNRPVNIVTNETAFQPGTGIVQSVTQTPVLSGGSSADPLKRLHVRMDNGRVQYVDTISDIARGSRIQLTSDRQIRVL